MELLQQCLLTHRSYNAKNTMSVFEFIGDSILNYSVARMFTMDAFEIVGRRVVADARGFGEIARVTETALK